MVKVLPKIILLLELFADGNEHTFSQVLMCSGLTRSNASHLLDSLCEERMLIRSGRGVYRSGERLVRLGGQDAFAELRRIARSCCIMASDALNELAVVGMRQGVCRITVAKLQPRRYLQITEESDARYPTDWYGTGNGRCLLAYAPRDILLEIVRRWNLPDVSIWREASTLPKLEKELARIRKQEYSVMTLADEVKIVSVPVRDAAGEQLLSLSTAFPLFRHQNEEDAILEKLRYCSTHLEEELTTAGIRIAGFQEKVCNEENR